jgi:hypothetical protein
MKEQDIIYDLGDFWVGRNHSPPGYTVYRTGTTHSVPDSTYNYNDDGLSIAKARADYLHKRNS